MGIEQQPIRIVGYGEQRKRLDIALQSGMKFVLIEGELGSGKTTIMREAMLKHEGLRWMKRARKNWNG